MQNKQPFVNGEAVPNIKFIAVKDHGQPEAVYKASGRVFYAEIQEDQEGQFYFLHVNSAHYLPKDFQPH